MKKSSVLLLTLIFALSLAACKKDNTSSDTSSLSNATSQAEQSKTDISDGQTNETGSEIEAANSSTASDKKGDTEKSNPKQNASSQPKSGAPSQNPSNNKPTQPTRPAQPTQPTQPSTPTKLNPKTNFKFGKYVAKYFDNNNQSYHKVSLEFHKDYEGVEYIKDNYYTKEYLKKLYQQWGEAFDEQGFYRESEVTLNGITYYNIGDYSQLPENYQLTDAVIRISPDNSKWSELSLNADGTLVLESVADKNRYAKVGTIFTLAQ